MANQSMQQTTTLPPPSPPPLGGGGVSLRELHLPNVRVYEARSRYWAGEILKGVSGGESLYLSDRPWGLIIHCHPDGKPYSVTFENGTVWSFCAMNDRLLNIEWPLFVKDYFGEAESPPSGDDDYWRYDDCGPKREISARVGAIYSDSMRLDLNSENACVNDMLIWRYPLVDN